MVSVDEIGKNGLQNILQEVKQLCSELGRDDPATLADLVLVSKNVASTMHENQSFN